MDTDLVTKMEEGFEGQRGKGSRSVGQECVASRLL
jgi:hypothetical protein